MIRILVLASQLRRKMRRNELFFEVCIFLHMGNLFISGRDTSRGSGETPAQLGDWPPFPLSDRVAHISL